MTVRIIHGDCREQMAALAADGVRVHAVVTDPPYHLTSIVKRFGAAGAAPNQHGTDGAFARASRGFMGKTWDGGDIAFDPDTWRRVFDVMHPGAHLVAFGGTRGWHRMACAIEDAGFEMRDTLFWAYGSGMPKSHSMARGMDKLHGVEGGTIATGAAVKRMIPGADQNGTGSWIKDNGRTYQPHDYVPASPDGQAWDGWGTGLKPAIEPIVLARKPLAASSVARNVLLNGCGALNIGACMVSAGQGDKPRWPANLLHDSSEEVVAAFPQAAGQQAAVGPEHGAKAAVNCYGDYGPRQHFAPRGDGGSAARFFYGAKADANDRAGSGHPTFKPTDLMRWLVRLITPPGGTVLDPFAGTGSTGLAADIEGFDAILIEQDATYVEDIKRKITRSAGLFAELLA